MCLTTFNNETSKKGTCGLTPTQCRDHLGKQYLMLSRKTALKTKTLKFKENACSSLWYAFMCTRKHYFKRNQVFLPMWAVSPSFWLAHPSHQVLHLHWTVLGNVILTVKLSRSHFHILCTTHHSLPCLHSLLSSREAQVSKNDYIYTIVSLQSSQYTAGDYI